MILNPWFLRVKSERCPCTSGREGPGSAAQWGKHTNVGIPYIADPLTIASQMADPPHWTEASAPHGILTRSRARVYTGYLIESSTAFVGARSRSWIFAMDPRLRGRRVLFYLFFPTEGKRRRIFIIVSDFDYIQEKTWEGLGTTK